MSDELLSTEEAAEVLGVSRHWLIRRRVEKNGPAFVEIGHFRKYCRSDLEAYITNNRVDPETIDG